MNNNLYAVLEWDDNNTIDAHVIATDQSYRIAKGVVDVTPSHYFRDIISMEELKDLTLLKR